MDHQDLQISKENNLEDFWFKAHEREKSFWTSGPSFEVIEKNYSLESIDKNLFRKVLVVGVGQGTELIGLKKLGFICTGVDIEASLKLKFSEFEIFTWQDLVGTYDLVIMNLVAQHCSDETLKIIFNTLRAHTHLNSKIMIQFSMPFNTRVKDYFEENGIDINNVETYISGSRMREFSEINYLAYVTNMSIHEMRIVEIFQEYSTVHAVVEFRNLNKQTLLLRRIKKFLKNYLGLSN
jgi:hypothetical protein